MHDNGQMKLETRAVVDGFRRIKNVATRGKANAIATPRCIENKRKHRREGNIRRQNGNPRLTPKTNQIRCVKGQGTNHRIILSEQTVDK